MLRSCSVVSRCCSQRRVSEARPPPQGWRPLRGANYAIGFFSSISHVLGIRNRVCQVYSRTVRFWPLYISVQGEEGSKYLVHTRIKVQAIWDIREQDSMYGSIARCNCRIWPRKYISTAVQYCTFTAVGVQVYCTVGVCKKQKGKNAYCILYSTVREYPVLLNSRWD